MRIGSYARSRRRGTFAVLCAFLATSAAEDQQIAQKLAALREPFGKRGGSR